MTDLWVAILAIGALVLLIGFVLWPKGREKTRPNAKNNWKNEEYTRFEETNTGRSTKHEFYESNQG